MKLNVTVAMDADKKAKLCGEVRSLSLAEQFLCGIKALGISWILAFVSIFIPVLHFFLVPGFLILGVIMFFIHFKRTELLMDAQLICPKCATTTSLKNLNFNWPLRQTCPHCQMVLLIDKEE